MQKAALTALGCDILQGYLLGAPMPAAALEQLLRKLPALGRSA